MARETVQVLIGGGAEGVIFHVGGHSKSTHGSATRTGRMFHNGEWTSMPLEPYAIYRMVTMSNAPQPRERCGGCDVATAGLLLQHACHSMLQRHSSKPSGRAAPRMARETVRVLIGGGGGDGRGGALVAYQADISGLYQEGPDMVCISLIWPDMRLIWGRGGRSYISA